VRSRPALGEIVPARPRPDLALEVENRGPGDVPAGRELVVTALDHALLGDFEERQVLAVPLPEVPSGHRLAALRVDLSAEQLGSYGSRSRSPTTAPGSATSTTRR
jgi:hypothetical protein